MNMAISYGLSVFIMCLFRMTLTHASVAEDELLDMNYTVKSCDFPHDGFRPKSCFGRTRFSKWTINSLPPNVCTFNLSSDSVQRIHEGVQRGRNFLTFILRFPNHNGKNCMLEKSVFNYSIWAWAYGGPQGVKPLLQAPYDFDILSFGLLALKKGIIHVDLLVNDPNCTITGGFNQTNKEITRLLHAAVTSVTDDDVMKINKDIKEDSSYCFVYYPDQLVDDTAYYISHMLGIVTTPNQFTSFKCCHPTTHRTHKTHETKVDCDNKVYVTSILQTLQRLSTSMFMFCPLLLIYLFGEKSSVKKRVSVEYERLNDESNTPDYEWISCNPYCSFVIVTALRGLGGTSVCASRIRRAVVFLFVIPSVLIIRLIVYGYLKYQYINDREEADLAQGMYALLLGFDRATYNWKCYLGGPYIIFPMCFTVGLFLVCLPRDIEDVFELGLLEESFTNKSPLFLDLYIISKYAAIDYKDTGGFRLLYHTMIARLLALLNRKFWKYCYFIWLQRFKSMMDSLNSIRLINERICIPIQILLLPFCLVVFVLVVMIEFILVLGTFGFPMVCFGIRFYLSYLRYMRTSIENSTRLRCFVDSRCLRYLFSALFFILLFYIFYGYSLIILSSFKHIIYTISYTILGLVVNANEMFKYSVVVIVVFVYIWKAGSGLFAEYEELFSMIVEISHSFKREQLTPVVSIDSGVLLLKTSNSFRSFDSIKINEEPTINIPVQNSYSYNVPPVYTHDVTYVRIVGGIVSIPKLLFESVVNEHLPLRNRIFVTIVKLAVTSFVWFLTMKAILEFERQNYLDKILQVLAILLTGFLPILCNIFSSSLSERNKQAAYYFRIKESIENFWSKEKYLNSTNLENIA